MPLKLDRRPAISDSWEAGKPSSWIPSPPTLRTWAVVAGRRSTGTALRSLASTGDGRVVGSGHGGARRGADGELGLVAGPLAQGRLVIQAEQRGADRDGEEGGSDGGPGRAAGYRQHRQPRAQARRPGPAFGEPEDDREQLWRRPLAAVIDAFADAGFMVDRGPEPQPSAEALQLFPDDLGAVVGVPVFIVFRLWLQRA
jgi:hypothetical protein